MIETNCPKCGKGFNISEEKIGKKAKCSSCGEIFLVEKVENKKVKIDDFKPNKWSFIIFNSGISFWFLLFLISVLVGLFFKIAFIVSGVLFLFVLFSYFWTSICYKKESYSLTDRKIIRHYGNLFSDNSVEVNIDKITEVSAILGFFQYNIFKTGNLLVKTAGASSSKINLRNIDRTIDFYEELQVKMRKNGFHLKKDKLVQEAKPHWLGVIGEVGGKVLSSLLFYFFIGFQGELFNSAGIKFFIIPFIIILIIIFGVILFSYLDLKRRKYDVYTDSVFYTEGFLTKNFSFLPMEKISDIENNQGFWSKIFGLHDIIVSSEGANNNVVFKNMTHGEQMIKNIKYLKNNITMTKKEISVVGEESKNESLIGYKDATEEEILDYDKDFTAVYKMNFVRTFAGSLFIILLGIISVAFYRESIFFAVIFAFSIGFGGIINFFFTKFIIDNSTIETKFNFLTNKHNSFSVEKITGVIFKENILDMIFKTCSIEFWSIGSNSGITFKNINKTENLEKEILSKVGINRQEDNKDIDINFNFLDFIKSNILIFIFLTISLSLFFIVLFLLSSRSYGDSGEILSVFYIYFGFLIFINLLNFFYRKFYYSKRFYKQKLYENFIYSRVGIFFRKRYLVLKRNIKGINSKKFPLTNTGKLKIDVSGEQLVQTQKGNRKTISIVGNHFFIDYVKDVFSFHNELDSLLLGKDIDKKNIKSSKQDFANSIIFVFIFMFIIFGYLFFLKNNVGDKIANKSFLTLLIFISVSFLSIIGFIIWYIKMKYYNLEKDRILSGSGIIYKRRHSILYKKFNFIEKNQNFLGKIFNNGFIKIYTLGSGSVDMVISDTSDYKEIYALLKQD